MSTLKVDAIRHNSATSDAITTAADGTCTANITSNYSNRSVVYNGAMKIAQRGTNFTGVTASGTFPVDRFLFHVGSLGTWTLSQSTDVPTGQGLSHSIKCDVTTANASPSGTAYARIDQRFEGQDLQRFCKGTSNAKNFAVSFWVKSPKTGTHIVQLQDQDNSRNVSKAYTVSSANTWEKKELIFPADTTGAFGNDNGGSLFLCFYLAVGTGYQGGTLQTTWGTPVNNTRATGQVNVADSTSNDFYLTGVQMEASSYCSEFEHRSYGDELARCSRYCQIWARGYCIGNAVGSNDINIGVPLTTPLRAVPTCNALSMHRSGNQNASCTFHSAQYTPPSLVLEVRMGNWTGGAAVSDEVAYAVTPVVPATMIISAEL